MARPNRSYSFEVDNLRKSIEQALKRGDVNLGQLVVEQLALTHAHGLQTKSFGEFRKVWNFVQNHIKPEQDQLMLTAQTSLWDNTDVLDGEIIPAGSAAPVAH